MRVENHNGVGNPNHDANGQFASNGGGGSASTPNVNIPNNKKSKPSYIVKTAEELNKKNKVQKPQKLFKEVKPQKQNNFANTMKNISNSASMKIASFILSGFNFNKLKGITKLNDKVFTPSVNKEQNNVVPQKVSNEEMQNLHKEGVAQKEINEKLRNLDKEYALDNDAFTKVNLAIDKIKDVRNVYNKKFGGDSQKFNEWWEQSPLKNHLFSLNASRMILKKRLNENDIKQKPLREQKQNYENKKKDLQQRLIARNQFVKQGGMQ